MLTLIPLSGLQIPPKQTLPRLLLLVLVQASERKVALNHPLPAFRSRAISRRPWPCHPVLRALAEALSCTKHQKGLTRRRRLARLVTIRTRCKPKKSLKPLRLKRKKTKAMMPRPFPPTLPPIRPARALRLLIRAKADHLSQWPRRRLSPRGRNRCTRPRSPEVAARPKQ